MPNRARFQSTYFADPSTLSNQNPKAQNGAKDIFRNIFKGGIEKR
jgi:hypothetical protein